MRNHFTFPGTYGSGKTPCDVHAVKVRGGFWYACNGSVNINFTPHDLTAYTRRINVELLPDTDIMTASRPVTDPADIESELEE